MVERLEFPEALRQELIAHAREGDPDEVCGILAGRDGQVSRVFRVNNTADSVSADSGVFRDRESGVASAGRKPVHYYMDPRDQLRVYNEVDDLGLDVIGYYHSHTHSEAYPSQTDVEKAVYPDSYWLILSLEDRGEPVLRGFRIDHGEVTEEEVKIR